MPEYLVLLAPSANRVYTAAAGELVAAELQVMADALDLGTVGRPGPVTVGEVDYLAVECDELSEQAVAALSNLSGCAALFERGTAQHTGWLRPLRLGRVDRFPSDLVTIQKYQGKTNEQLTKLLLNVTVLATDRPWRLLDGSISVLDPLCGRGTTLNQALTYGFDATGIDLDERDFEAYATFVKTWLRMHRYKHHAVIGSIRTDRRHRGRRLDLELAAEKADYKAGRVQQVHYLCTDTGDLHGLLKPACFDVIVADTPYGVRHGSHGDRLVRSPLGLLDQAMPGWVRVLRPGGAIGLAINRHVAPRQDVTRLLEAHGLQVCTQSGYEGFRHRVDAAIDRDLVVARRMAHRHHHQQDGTGRPVGHQPHDTSGSS